LKERRRKKILFQFYYRGQIKKEKPIIFYKEAVNGTKEYKGVITLFAETS